MLVSLDWLRRLCPFSDSADDAARALTARGLTVDGVQDAGKDTILDLDVPANRPDCLGHLGVARELSAAFGVALRSPLVSRSGSPGACGERVSVEIDSAELCPRYTARVVRGVRVGPSPPWVTRLLESCGVRSINNVVDASNLVLLELGNPIHFFDLSLVPAGRIVVRAARSGEKLTTLDGIERDLHQADLVIADTDRPIALAGIMGGAETEIHQGTTDVLVEAASFRPGTIRATARRLGLHTEASHRFERGVDPEGVPAAQELATRLLGELAAGEAVAGTVDAYPAPAGSRTIRVRMEHVRRLLGYAPSLGDVREAFGRLGISVLAVDQDETISVEPPSFRVDLEREADLVEEIARHLGYDRIPSGRRTQTARPAESARRALDCEERARDMLARRGFHETFCYAMIGDGDDDPFVDDGSRAGLRLDNPIAEPMSCLRRSLMPGLLGAADRNFRRGVSDLRLFELGTVFLNRGEGEFPIEPSRLGIVWCGAASPAHWSRPTPEVDLHWIVGLVETLLAEASPGLRPRRSAGGPGGLHPGRALRWSLETEEAVGWCGALHPDLRDRLGLPDGVYLAELDLEPVVRGAGKPVQYRPLPRFPAVQRDLSLVLPRQLPYGDVETVLRDVPAPAAAAFSVVDRYLGEPLADDEVSLTVRVVLSPSRATLTDDEIESFRNALVNELARRLSVRLRGQD